MVSPFPPHFPDEKEQPPTKKEKKTREIAQKKRWENEGWERKTIKDFFSSEKRMPPSLFFRKKGKSAPFTLFFWQLSAILFFLFREILLGGGSIPPFWQSPGRIPNFSRNGRTQKERKKGFPSRDRLQKGGPLFYSCASIPRSWKGMSCFFNLETRFSVALVASNNYLWSDIIMHFCTGS